MLIAPDDPTIGDLFESPDAFVMRQYRDTVGSALAATDRPPLHPRWRRDQYHLRDFVAEAWNKVETHPFKPGWHIDAMCDHFEALIETVAPERHQPELPEVRRNLLVNIPPRCSKSIIVAVMLPAYVWITWPECCFVYISYSQQLALRDAEKSRQLMQSDWYKSRWGDQWQFSGTQAVKSFYYNTQLGSRFSSSIGGSATGFGGDIVIADDAHAAQEDHSETRAEIETAKMFWRDVIPSRSTDPTKMAKIVVGQRIAPDDISEMLIEQGNYDYLCIPMEFDEEGQEVALRSHTALGYRDPRFASGEFFLQPDRFTADVVDEYKIMGRRYHAQYQQNPSAEGLSLFPRSWWQYYDTILDPDWFDVILASYDFRFKDEKDGQGSFVAAHIWARRGPDVFLLDREFEQYTFTECLDLVQRFWKKWPDAQIKLIENKANGPAIYATLRSVVPGIVPVQVGGANLRKGGGSKYQRAESQAWIAKFGHAWLPSPKLCPWVEDFVTNCFRFPALPDDDVDALSQAWRVLIKAPPAKDPETALRRKRNQMLQQHIEQVKREKRGAQRRRTYA